MTGKERFHTAMEGKPTDVIATMPKLWLDLSAQIMDIPFLDVMCNPALASRTIIEAAKKINADGARLFLFPFRRIVPENGRLIHVNNGGSAYGEIDIQGGWNTLLQNPASFNIENPDQMAFYHFWHSSGALVEGVEDVKRISVPSVNYYEQAGYGSVVEDTVTAAGDYVGCAGDCGSGTLAFLIAMRGMSRALTDLCDDPSLVHAVMDKGIEMALERARFFINHGLKILRYNDSAANMSVISPTSWREFILPHLRQFCSEVHSMNSKVKVYCHICGNILPIAADLAGSGLDCIAPLDPLGGFTVGQFRQVVGNPVTLMGGVNTLSFIQSSKQDIRLEAEQCILGGTQGGGSFILGSGCMLPRSTKRENLDEFINTAHAYTVLKS
ncbi:MAG: uroporphyrinogen decarboxylase family protein [Clostridiaceae bacterium]|nr:uroporphyrinogen decarboxylase family protein [Clostridiaceae bacterium]